MSAPLNCGTETHPTECLCDVVITEPVDINYRLNDIWHMEIIMRHLKLSNPYKSKDLAKMLEALGLGYDATRNVAGLPHAAPEGMWDARNEMFDLLKQGNSIIDIPEMLGIEWGAVLQILTANHASKLWTWTEQEWATAEDSIRDPNGPSADDAAALLGIHVNTVRDLWDWYGASFGAAQSRRTAAAKRELCAQTTHLSAKDAVAVFAQNGVEISVASLYVLRSRMKQKKNLADAPRQESMAS